MDRILERTFVLATLGLAAAIVFLPGKSKPTRHAVGPESVATVSTNDESDRAERAALASRAAQAAWSARAAYGGGPPPTDQPAADESTATTVVETANTTPAASKGAAVEDAGTDADMDAMPVPQARAGQPDEILDDAGTDVGLPDAPTDDAMPVSDAGPSTAATEVVASTTADGGPPGDFQFYDPNAPMVVPVYTTQPSALVANPVPTPESTNPSLQANSYGAGGMTIGAGGAGGDTIGNAGAGGDTVGRGGAGGLPIPAGGIPQQFVGQIQGAGGDTIGIGGAGGTAVGTGGAGGVPIAAGGLPTGTGGFVGFPVGTGANGMVIVNGGGAYPFGYVNPFFGQYPAFTPMR